MEVGVKLAEEKGERKKGFSGKRHVQKPCSRRAPSTSECGGV